MNLDRISDASDPVLAILARLGVADPAPDELVRLARGAFREGCETGRRFVRDVPEVRK